MPIIAKTTLGQYTIKHGPSGIAPRFPPEEVNANHQQYGKGHDEDNCARSLAECGK